MSKRYFRISSGFIKDFLSFYNRFSEKRIANGCQFYEINGYLKELLKIFREAEVVVSMLDRGHRLKLDNEIKIA